MMSGLQGGNFWSGFSSGALSSIASSLFSKGFDHEGLNADGSMKNAKEVYGGFGKIAENTTGQIAFGTIMGGVGASLTGGNFWQGAATGLMVTVFNDLMHQIKQRNIIRSKLSNPDGIPEVNKSSVETIKEEVHSLFTKDMKDSENRSQVQVGGSNGSKNGDFEYSMSENGYGGSETTIKIYRSAFKSNYILARTILHEYYHAGDFYSGRAGTAMYNLRNISGLRGNRLQNAYTDYFEKGAFNFVRRLGASNDGNYFYNPKLYHK
jgi:hypothetical protein